MNIRSLLTTTAVLSCLTPSSCSAPIHDDSVTVGVMDGSDTGDTEFEAGDGAGNAATISLAEKKTENMAPVRQRGIGVHLAASASAKRARPRNARASGCGT